MCEIKVFISYARIDEEAAEALEDSLNELSIESFRDTGLRYGVNFRRQIEEQIESCTHLVVLVSKQSIQNTWVLHEITSGRRAGMNVLPVLIEDGIQLEPTLDSGLNYPRREKDQLVPDQVASDLIDYGLFADGIVPKKLFDRYPRRLPGEVFAAEILTVPPVLRRFKNGRVSLEIDRTRVKELVVSTPGKKRLCAKHVAGRRQELIQLDEKISSFIREQDDAPPLELPGDLPLRWASGGVLSVVSIADRRWVPLFFRDIEPIGWNVSLGASERWFESDFIPSKEPGWDLESELANPWRFVLREFLEETLVLSEVDTDRGEAARRSFMFSSPIDQRISGAQAHAFAEKHVDIRFSQYRDRNMKVERKGKPIYADIQGRTCMEAKIRGTQRPSKDILFSINPLELGIEIVFVCNYELDETDVMLDGEILLSDKRGEDKRHLWKQLVRMPVALISLEYLYRNFGAPDYSLVYTDDEVQPSVVGTPFASNRDIRVFTWDVEERLNLGASPLCDEEEMKRYARWRDHFAADFQDGLKGNPGKFPSLFTPATAKTLNLYFNMSEDGRRAAARLRTRC